VMLKTFGLVAYVAAVTAPVLALVLAGAPN
jgi:hypothetical protein